MSEFRFTPAQQDAIDVRGGPVIVSAAAGAGKTRVLVERVIKRLTDRFAPVDADRLLIVTFTKAAAAEMKSRISDALESLINEEPDNHQLRKQQMLLPNADICTVHSFCSKTIRDNFYDLDIPRDFRIASESESSVLRHETMSELIEEMYSQGQDSFLTLADILSGRKHDRNFEKILLDVYDKANSHPFPSEWLRMASALYDPNLPLTKSEFAVISYKRAFDSLDYIKKLLSETDTIINEEYIDIFDTGKPTSAVILYSYLVKYTDDLEKMIGNGGWDEINAAVNDFYPPKYISPRKKKDWDPDIENKIDTVKSNFDSIKKIITEEMARLFSLKEAEYTADNEYLYPAVCCMCSVIEEFGRRYFEEKKERGILDYSDLEHLMLRLLVRQGKSGPEKTEYASVLSEKYDEIMIDEYQDTNEIQELIFRSVSRDESNIFVVGDVKQSIYRFREAMPDLFINRRSKSLLYDRKSPIFPAKIILDCNFRSSESIIDSINYVFSCLMSEDVGEIDYNEEEMLEYAADYESSDEAGVEFHILDGYTGENKDNDDMTASEREAEYIAGLIKKMVNGESFKLNRKDSDNVPHLDKTPGYSDICILMRNLSSTGQVYAEILNRHGIPTYIDRQYSLFDCQEVNAVLSLLRVVDNPMQDIHIIAAMVNPVFGFTPDDLAELKSCGEKYMYNNIRRYAGNDDCTSGLMKKCRYFLSEMDILSTYSVTMPAAKVLDKFYDRSGYIPAVSAMENGEIRVKNLRKLSCYIREFESGGRTCLSDFIRHIDNLEENGDSITASDTAPVDSVRIMTIHHSKGLEFPICILASLESEGNKMPDEIMCHSVLGFGMKTVEKDSALKFNTLQRNVIAYKKKEEETSEAMRLLYVAMTRAKEKLIPVITISSRSEDGFSRKLKSLAKNISIENGRLHPYTVGKTSRFSDWLLMCAMLHPDMRQLRDIAEGREDIIIPSKSKWSCVIGETVSTDKIFDPVKHEEICIDKELEQLIQERFSQKYKYQYRVAVPAKVAASALVHSHLQLHHAASSRPAFMQQHNMTGAEKGTAMHTFLEYADFTVDLGNTAEQQMSHMLDNGFISNEQYLSLDKEEIIAFSNSRTYGYIRNAAKKGNNHLLREYRFTVNLKASDVDDNYDCDDPVILQGAIDCIVIEDDGLIIIDYKTDRVKDISELSQRYHKQLSLYKIAAEQLFQLPVKKCVIYSLHCSDEITVDA